MMKAKNGAGEVIYEKVGYEKFTELVDDYEAITEELLKAPPIARTTSGIISRGRMIYHFKGSKEGEELDELPRALRPGTLSNINSLLHEIEKQAEEIRIKPRGLSGVAYGFAKASDNLITGMLEIYKAPGALVTLLTDAEVQNNLYEELKKGVGELRDGDAEAWGGALLNIPLTISGVGGAAKGTATVSRVTLKVSGATAKKLVASGIKGKALALALLKAEVVEANVVPKSMPGKLPPGIREYIRDVEVQTGRTIPQKQIGILIDALRMKNYEKLSKAGAALNRLEFDKVKNKIILDWEKETGQTWPRYAEDVLSKDGEKVVRKKGAAYDAHHIIENELGGPAEWWNIHPAKFPGEHQGGIHSAGSPLGNLLQNIK
jgi:hypothetical protein